MAQPEPPPTVDSQSINEVEPENQPVVETTTTRRLKGLITAYVAHRNGILIGTSNSASRREIDRVFARESAEIRGRAEERLALAENQLPRMRRLLADLGEEDSRSHTEMELVEVTEEESNTSVSYRETTTIYYRPGLGHPEYTAYSADYLAQFEAGPGRSVVLTSIDLVDPSGEALPPVTEPVEGADIPDDADEMFARLEANDSEIARGRVGEENDPPDPVIANSSGAGDRRIAQIGTAGSPGSDPLQAPPNAPSGELAAQASAGSFDVARTSFYAWVH